MLFTLLGAGETTVNKGTKIFAPVELTFELGKGRQAKEGDRLKKKKERVT